MSVDREIYMVIFETGYHTIYAFQTEWKLYFHTSCAIIYTRLLQMHMIYNDKSERKVYGAIIVCALKDHCIHA